MSGWLVEGVYCSGYDGYCEYVPGLNDVGDCQKGEDEDQCGGCCLADGDEADLVEPIGYDASDQVQGDCGSVLASPTYPR